MLGEPLYNIDKTYAQNVAEGPVYSGKAPPRILIDRQQWIDFLGFPVASRLGVPAGPLLTSQWTTLAAQLGFDIVTYKTIRSQAHVAHPLPNVSYVHPLNDHTALFTKTAPLELQNLAITNSFGMPSQSSEFLMRDIRQANEHLSEGQVLVVSVVGTHRPQISFTQDFVQAARFAKEAGAKIIEANFSCPNVTTGEGSLYTYPEAFQEIGSALIKTLKETPLIIKVGAFPDTGLLKEILNIAARIGVRAISGINSVSMRVLDDRAQPALGTQRPTSGICGAPIRQAGLHFVQTARKIIDAERLPLTLIGMGGIVHEDHFNDFFNAGADIAMTATGMMWKPELAYDYMTKENHACSRVNS